MKLHVLKPLDARIPKWDITLLKERLCPFCGSKNRTVLVRPDNLPVAFCSTCSCWYINSLPSLSDIKRQYEGYYRSQRPTQFSKKSASLMLKNAKKTSQIDWQVTLLSKLVNGLVGKSVMEVGCGTGGFLLSLKCLGADVVGCDLSPEACDFVNSQLNIKVYQKALSECISSIEKVDAVVMRDFIEHPVEPLVDIEAAISILKPGGVLLLHTPNGGEAGINFETAKDWVGFRVDLEHLQYLSSKTVNWISKKFDLTIESLITFGWPGLRGIDKIPRLPGKFSIVTKQALGSMPGVRKTVKILRTIKSEMINGGTADFRLGSYHLFFVYRKGSNYLF